LILPITGVGEVWISWSRVSNPPSALPALAPLLFRDAPAAAESLAAERSFKLAPAQKVEPSFVITMARTAGSAFAAAIASSRPPTKPAPRAFRFSTSTSVTVITPSVVSTLTSFMMSFLLESWRWIPESVALVFDEKYR